VIQGLGNTYEWKTAVGAPADLGLVHVDEDPGMSKRSTSTIARNYALVCPTNGLLMDEFDRSVWAGLYIQLLPIVLPCCEPIPDLQLNFQCLLRLPQPLKTAKLDVDIPDPP
jgi:hypothetical protein